MNVQFMFNIHPGNNSVNYVYYNFERYFVSNSRPAPSGTDTCNQRLHPRLRKMASRAPATTLYEPQTQGSITYHEERRELLCIP